MRVIIRSPHVDVDPELREHIGAAVRPALEHVEGRITSVQVHLDDLNGPKGGVDKKCECVANCGKLGVLRAEAVHKDVRKAVDAAVTKLQRAIDHAVDHKRGARLAKAPRRRT